MAYTGNTLQQKTYLLANHQGSIISEIDDKKVEVNQHKYGPYGELLSKSDSRFRYTGQMLIPGTELYYYKARVYNPKLGRFMQTDPVGYDDQMNLYTYVANDPINHTDPKGKFLQLVGMVIGAYSAYSAAQDLGLDSESTFLAVASGAAIGAITGGIGSTAAATTFKQGVIQAAKATATQTASKVVQGGAVGGVSAAATSSAVQLAGSDDGSIDGTKVAVDTVKGVVAGTLGGTTTAVLGTSTAAKTVAAGVSSGAENTMNVPYDNEKKN